MSKKIKNDEQSMKNYRAVMNQVDTIATLMQMQSESGHKVGAYMSASMAWKALEAVACRMDVQGIDYEQVIGQGGLIEPPKKRKSSKEEYGTGLADHFTAVTRYPVKNDPLADYYLDLKRLFEKMEQGFGKKEFECWVDMCEGRKTTREIAEVLGYKSNKSASNWYRKRCADIETEMYKRELLVLQSESGTLSDELQLRADHATKFNPIDGVAKKETKNKEQIDESEPIFPLIDGKNIKAWYIKHYNGKYIITEDKKVYRDDDGKWTSVAIWGPEEMRRVELYSSQVGGTRYQPSLDDLYNKYFGPEKIYYNSGKLVNHLLKTYKNFRCPMSGKRIQLTQDEAEIMVYGHVIPAHLRKKKK